MAHRNNSPPEIIPEEQPEDVQDDSSQYEIDDDGESLVGSEYPENDIRVLADTLITANGEAIADVMVGIRDALDKLTKVLYSRRK